MTAKKSALTWAIIALLLLPLQTLGQSDKRKSTPEPEAKKQQTKSLDAELSEADLPAFAISLVISLGNEARSYSDISLRPRVLARAADVLWEADSVTARDLFKRAWDEAEKGDADEVTIKTKDNPPAMVTALRRMSGRDLRLEVLSVIAKRDRALSEEFFAKLKNENDSSKKDTKNTAPPGDPWFVPEAVSKRLQVASALLKEGQTDKALEFAAPVLIDVNSHTIRFLSELRAKNAEAADRVFASLLSRAEGDPASDANTVSGLSSYVFTPGLYITFKPEGGTTWSQPDEPPVPPVNFPATLRERFFQVATSILLRPLPPSDSGAREIKSSVIKRLLPLFEQHVPDTATALRTQLQEMSSNSRHDLMGNNPMLTEGISPAPTADDLLEQMQRRLDRAKTPRERDSIYAFVAAALCAQGDVLARDIADKIEDVQRRTEIRQYIDFEFVQRAIRKKATTEALRLAQTGKLSHTQRASAYIDVARLLMKTERRVALDLIEEAVREVNRIEVSNKPDRALLLVGIANQLMAADRVRAWEIIGEAVKEANRVEGFTGVNTIHFPLMTGSGVRLLNIGGENFSLTNVFSALAKDDLYRAVDLVKSFKYDAPRANVTLAIASSILTKPKKD